MKLKSAVSNFGLAVVFPDAISIASDIIREMGRNVHACVAVLHHEQRILTAEEAFKIYQLVEFSTLADVGGGYDTASLTRAFSMFCGRIERMQKEEVVLIAFDNWLDRSSYQIKMNAPHIRTEHPVMWDFDCVTGENAQRFKCLFSQASWEKIEEKAREYAVLTC